MFCIYKWALRMPLYIKETNEYLTDLENDHLDNIMIGKDVILLSRLFSDSVAIGNGFYFLLNFDFDFHGRHGSHLDNKTVLKSVKQLSNKLTSLKIDHYFENSTNGVHVVSTDAYKTNMSDIISLRTININAEKFYPGLDSNYLMPKGVVHRFGSYINGKTIRRWDDYESMLENFHNSSAPENIMQKEKWMEEFKSKLIPNVYSLRSATELLKNIFL